MQCFDRRFQGQPAEYELVLLSFRSQAETHPLHFADRIPFHVAKPLSRAVHRSQYRGEHLRMVTATRLVDEWKPFDVAPPLRKPDKFQRDDDDRSTDAGRRV